MKSIRNRRLRTPIAMLAWGAVLAAAVAIGHGGAGGVIAGAVVCIAAAVYYYRAGGQDSDYGALIGDRADERQALIRTRARALAGTVMAAAALAGAVVELALRGAGHWGSYWPFGLVVVVGAISYGWAGHRGGVGALIGGRADERQALIRTRAWSLSAYAMAAVAVTGVVVTVALGSGHLPGSYGLCQLLLIVGTVSYNIGLRRYGARGADDDLPEPMYNWWGGQRRVKPTE
jgi:hypothetical protein